MTRCWGRYDNVFTTTLHDNYYCKGERISCNSSDLASDHSCATLVLSLSAVVWSGGNNNPKRLFDSFPARADAALANFEPILRKEDEWEPKN